MDLDMTSIDRLVYGFVDWMSDMGGMSSTLISIFTVLFMLFKFNEVDFYMISKLYT